ncbi:MAG: HK97 gp10 family phage protein [Pseudomonadales bacterium]|nr:HK97 gp10 family phage protein [Pseudomonadales bacterium]NRA15198.1 HK97 gp10 family phage protein [Oceanospirillaceae bacterium]
MEIKWEVKGLADLEKQLTALGAEVGLKALRTAARTAMKPVQEQMKRTAPFDKDKSGAPSAQADKGEIAARTQHMNEKIGITTKKLDKKAGKTTALSVRVGPTKAHSQKAIAAEYGTAKQTATPFMRASLFDNKELVVRTMKNKLAAEIRRITQKRAR